MASAIAFATRYRSELFFHTEVNIIALQAAFGFLILGIVALALLFLYRDVSSILTDAIESAVSTSPEILGARITEELRIMSVRNISTVVGSIIVVTAIFGYVVARITLAPARNALASQKKFIGNIAHELRTPLSTIKTNIEVRLMGEDVPSEARASHESNLEEIDRMSDIINNLLSLNSSLDPERVRFSDIDLGIITETAIRKLIRLAERKNIEITTRMSEWRVVWGNATALEQVVTNLVKNAIMYTPNKGRIGITIEPIGPNAIELTVQDSGIGIPPKDLVHIFEPFYRSDPSRNRTMGGSGLGLTIVNELVKLHNGKISIRSIEKRGTTVTVTLPAGSMGGSDGGERSKHATEVAVDHWYRRGARTKL